MVFELELWMWPMYGSWKLRLKWLLIVLVFYWFQEDVESPMPLTRPLSSVCSLYLVIVITFAVNCYFICWIFELLTGWSIQHCVTDYYKRYVMRWFRKQILRDGSWVPYGPSCTKPLVRDSVFVRIPQQHAWCHGIVEDINQVLSCK